MLLFFYFVRFSIFLSSGETIQEQKNRQTIDKRKHFFFLTKKNKYFPLAKHSWFVSLDNLMKKNCLSFSLVVLFKEVNLWKIRKKPNIICKSKIVFFCLRRLRCFLKSFLLQCFYFLFKIWCSCGGRNSRTWIYIYNIF